MNRTDLLALLSTLPDEAILALTLYGETRGEPIEGQIAVGCVIRNRATDAAKRWGTTVRDVCLQPMQFSCWQEKGGAANYATLVEAAQKLAQKQAVSSVMEQCSWVSLGLSRGAILDTVKGANHYHTVSMVPRPKWAQTQTPVQQRGAHLFYRL